MTPCLVTLDDVSISKLNLSHFGGIALHRTVDANDSLLSLFIFAFLQTTAGLLESAGMRAWQFDITKRPDRPPNTSSKRHHPKLEA